MTATAQGAAALHTTPPDPRRYEGWRDYALALGGWQDRQRQMTMATQPESVLLVNVSTADSSAPRPPGLARATADGLLVFDPSLKRIRLAYDSEWHSLGLEGEGGGEVGPPGPPGPAGPPGATGPEGPDQITEFDEFGADPTGIVNADFAGIDMVAWLNAQLAGISATVYFFGKYLLTKSWPAISHDNATLISPHLRLTDGSVPGAIDIFRNGSASRLLVYRPDIIVEPRLSLPGTPTNVVGWGGPIWLEQPVVDGMVTYSGGVRNHLANILTLTSGNHEGLTISGGEFRRMAYGILKANTLITTEKRIKLLHNTFSEFATVAALFNSPGTGSLMSDILVSGNTLGSNLNPDGTHHRGSFAGHVEYARVLGNHATGIGGEIFRAEEAAKAVVMGDNTGEHFGPGSHAYEIVGNNIGGTAYTPSLFALHDNVHVVASGFDMSGTGPGEMIALQYLAAPNTQALHDSTIHDNVGIGWQGGVRTSVGANRTLVHHNVFKDMAYGLRVQEPTLGVEDNLLTDVTEAAVFTGAGLLGRFHWRSSGTLPPKITATPASGGGPCGFTGWTYEALGFNLPTTGTTYLISLADAGYFIDADVRMWFMYSAASHEVNRGQLKWDGTTVTYTVSSKRAAGVPVISTTPFTVVGGVLTLSLAKVSGTAYNGCKLQVQLDGLHVFKI